MSPWLARKDADYWVDVLNDFAHDAGATTIRTALSRTVVDVNRDPRVPRCIPARPPRPCARSNFRRRTALQARHEPDAAEIELRTREYSRLTISTSPQSASGFAANTTAS